jgi:hypothetical protein
MVEIRRREGEPAPAGEEQLSEEQLTVFLRNSANVLYRSSSWFCSI